MNIYLVEGTKLGSEVQLLNPIESYNLDIGRSPETYGENWHLVEAVDRYMAHRAVHSSDMLTRKRSGRLLDKSEALRTLARMNVKWEEEVS